MMYFKSDYTEGAHPKVLEALEKTNLISQSGYGADCFCASAAEKIAAACGRDDLDVYFLTGGTQTNQVVISTLLQRFEGVVCADSGHIAVHEAGHATVSWHLQYADPLIKVTIVPRGKALGAAWYMPEERQIEPKQALLDKMCSLLAGRMAEEMFLGFIDTGALNDLERATKMAYAMVTYYGMSDKLPNISYYDSSGQAYGFTKPYSEDRAKAIDDEVQAIINSQYLRARQILEQYQRGHHELADLLVQREVIYTEDAERIFGKRQWLSRTDEIIKANEEAKRARGEVQADDIDNDTDPQPEGTTPPPFNQ